MDLKGKKIFVGLSGGVDSAVSAALLKEAGAQVFGVFIKGWYPRGMPCTWAEERRDAMRVAARLHIPFLTLDASAEYKTSVIDYLLSEYRAGRTPNPDVMCNRNVKFGAFYRFAKEKGADAIATGHYRSGEKDQSYFLWAVPKEILSDAVFPVGQMEKTEVRHLAKRFHLPVAEKNDSQGICFLGSVSVEDFLKQEFGEQPGIARDEQGTPVGDHTGVLFHTIGERIALQNSRNGPWFVLSKDIPKNELIVGHDREPKDSSSKAIIFDSANWHEDPSKAILAQYRYRGLLLPGQIEGNRFVAGESLPEAVAAGQSVVFYGSGGLVGGGIISA